MLRLEMHSSLYQNLKTLSSPKMKESDKMFSFFHRTSKIHLDCFTYMTHTYEMTPIVYAMAAAPQWWKNLDKSELSYDWKHFTSPRKSLNMKSCYGFIELYKRGVVLDNWCDLKIKVDSKGFRYMFSDGQNPDEHSRHQMGEGFKNYHHLKLTSPWIFKEKTGVKFHFSGATWNLEDYNVRVLPGVVDYRVNGYTHVNIMIPKVEYEHTIPAGQALAHIVPLSDKKLRIKNHLISKQEFDTMCRHSSSLYAGWRGVKKLLDRNDERQKKCPFGFGE